jgi:SAM-dependent methyltransferase
MRFKELALRTLRNALFQGLIRLGWRKIIFAYFYRFNIWGSSESRSGDGSTLEYTEPLRSQLPKLLMELDIQTVLDAPCGDFNWFADVLRISGVNVKYRGVDIVENLVRHNSRTYAIAGKIEFECQDLVSDPIGEFDLVIARDFLIHLSYEDSFKFLSNFCLSNSKFLLTTSYPWVNINSDIPTGKFREINLLEEPYSMRSARGKALTDYIAPFPERYLYLFTRLEVIEALSKRNKYDHE